MSRLSKQRAAGITGAVLLFVLLCALFSKFSEVGQGPPGERRLPDPGKGSATGDAAPKQLLASGVERSLTQQIPLLGSVNGARWISGHKFRRELAAWEFQAFGETPPLDILVDGAGNFIMARLQGERYRTAVPRFSLELMLSEFPGRKMRHWGFPNNDGPSSLVERVSLARIPWEDTRLAQFITNMHHDTFSLSGRVPYDRYEQTTFVLEVIFKGQSEPRQIMITRTTDGLSYEKATDHTETADTGDRVAGANAFGAMVITQAVDFSGPDTNRYGSCMYLMEPWVGACPWPADKLDPLYGDNLLTEFKVPVEFYQNMERFMAPLHNLGVDQLRKAAEQRKATRLAQEAVGNRPGER